MAELLRSIIAQIREWVGNHRRTPRHDVRLPVSVSLLDAQPTVSGARRLSSLQGHTRDISATGLALIMPNIRIGERYLTTDERTLQVSCELPTGLLQMRAAPVRYEPLVLDDTETETGYLIGAHITGISGSDRVRLIEYLRTLH